MARCSHLVLLMLLSAPIWHKASSFQITSNVNFYHSSHHWTCPTPTTVLSKSSTTREHTYKSLLHLSSSYSNDEKPYFLRKALMADLSQAAKILVDGFYSDNNSVSKWWEKLQTQMSLESNLPHPYSHPQHEMWVACDAKTGQVLAFCEVDNRPPKKRQQEQREENAGAKELLVVRPYMCNLAVHADWRRQGLARDLIRQCESSVELWQDATYIMFLKVKKHNEAAVKLYTALGYKVTATEFDDKTQDTLLVMQREWTDHDSQDEVLINGIDSMNAGRNEIPISSSSYEI